MSRKSGRQQVGVALFPFLAVLICTMGALIVLLVLLVQQARVDASTVAAAQVGGAQADDNSELRRRLEDAQWQREVLEKSRAEKAEELTNARARVAHLEEHIHRLEAQAKELLDRARAIDEGKKLRSEDLAAARDEAKRLKDDIDKKKKELDEAKKKAGEGQEWYALIPYDGRSGTRRRPIYVECTEFGVIIQPEGILLKAEDFAALGPGNPLDSALRAIREHYERTAGAKAAQPYPLLVVRPSGVYAFDAARMAIRAWDDEWGYELISDEKQLDFGPPDPALNEVLNKTVSVARQRQAAIVAMMPRTYQRQEQLTSFAPEPKTSNGGPRSVGGTGTGAGGGLGGSNGQSGSAGGGLSGGNTQARSASDGIGSGYGVGTGYGTGGNGTGNGTGPGMGTGSVAGNTNAPGGALAGAPRYGNGGGPAGGYANGPAGVGGGYGNGTPGTPGYGNGTAGGSAYGNSAAGNRTGGGGSGSGGAGGYGNGMAGGTEYGNATPGYGNGGAGGGYGNGAPGGSGYANGGAGGTAYGTGSSNGGANGGSGAYGSGGSGSGAAGAVGFASASGGSGNGASGGGAAGTSGIAAFPNSPLNGSGGGNGVGGSGTSDGNGGPALGSPTDQQFAAGGAGGGSGGSGSGGSAGGQPGSSSPGDFASAGGSAGQGGSSAAGGGSFQAGGSPSGGSSSSAGGSSMMSGGGGQSGGSPFAGSSMAGGSPGGMGMPSLNFGQSQPQFADSSSATSSKSGGGPKSTAKRGANWALPAAKVHHTGVTRPIQINLQPDRVVLLPERGDNRGPQTVKVAPELSPDDVDHVVAAVQNEVKGWGLAVSEGYWKPVLQANVAPGAERHFENLQTALKGSGIEIIRK